MNSYIKSEPPKDYPPPNSFNLVDCLLVSLIVFLIFVAGCILLKP
jgi:hypothetical protein